MEAGNVDPSLLIMNWKAPRGTCAATHMKKATRPSHVLPSSRAILWCSAGTSRLLMTTANMDHQESHHGRHQPLIGDDDGAGGGRGRVITAVTEWFLPYCLGAGWRTGKINTSEHEGGSSFTT